jgi:hypothetical protein
MGIGVSVLLIAVGAILAFGVNAATDVANIDVIGFILMACGALGLVIALVAMGGSRRGDTVVQDHVVERERVI